MLLFLLFKLIVTDFNEVILKYIKIYISSLFLHIYISIYTDTYIFDTYIFRTDNTILWSVNPLSFFLFNWLIIGVIKCGQIRMKPYNNIYTMSENPVNDQSYGVLDRYGIAIVNGII